MANSNQNSPPVGFSLSEFEKLQHMQLGEPDPSSDEYTRYYLNLSPYATSPDRGVNLTEDTIDQTNGDSLNKTLRAFESSMSTQTVQSSMRPVEFATNDATSEVNDEDDALTATLMIMRATRANNVESSIGTVEVATNVSATTMDTVAQIDADALTMALVAIGSTIHQDGVQPQVTTNVATSEVNMTNGLTKVNNYVRNLVDKSKTLDMLATAAQNSVVDNETVMVFDIKQRRMSRFSLDERLQNWLITMSVRNDNIRIDKFYTHLWSNQQFRSLNEVDDFICLGYLPKRSEKEAKPFNNSAEASISREKRSTRKKLNWEFRFTGKVSNGENVLYDIHFLDFSSNQDPNNSRGFRVNEEIFFSSGGKTNDPEKHRRKRRKTIELTLKERVESFLSEAYHNLLNKGNNNEDQDDKGGCSKDKGKRKMYED